MKNIIKNTLIKLFNPISPTVTLMIGWLLTVLVTQPNDKFPDFINFMIENPIIIMAFIILWLIFSAVYTELINQIDILKKEIDNKQEIIKEKESHLIHTSGIVLNRSGDFAKFNRTIRFYDALVGFVQNNTLVESAQIYQYSIKRITNAVTIKVVYDSGYVYEDIDINNLAQTYYEFDYLDYNKLCDIIKTWKKLSMDSIETYREKDILIDYVVKEITALFKKYYTDLINLPNVSCIENKHFTEYRILTLLIRLARRLSTTTMDNRILGEDKSDIEYYLLNGKRTGILSSILLEDVFMFKYTRNSHTKNGRAYVSFHANITSQNYIIVFSVQTSDLDKYTNLEYEIKNLIRDFVNRLNKK